jgi:hypothetical protein
MDGKYSVPLGQVGAQYVAENGDARLRAGVNGELITGTAHGKYYEAVSRGNVFYAASQDATTWSVELDLTHTGLVVYNPIGSGVNLSMLQAGFSLTVAPVAITHISIFGGGSAAGITVHTTPLVPACMKLGGNAPKAGADAAATLVGAPVHLLPFMGGFTAGALYATSPSVVDIDGSILVPPGYYCGLASLTAAVGFGALVWEEVPV